MSRTHSARAPRDPADVPCAERESASVATMRRDASWRGHLVWLRTKLRGRFSPELADDLAQETYLRIVGRKPPITADNPRGLLITIATNLARDVFRRERVRADYAAETMDLEGDIPLRQRTAEDDLQVREAILSLPPQLREVLLLSKIGGLTNREIAQRYGLTVRAIDKRLQKAVTLFVAHLRD